MLLKALKSNNPYNFLLIPLLAVGLWVKSFLHPAAYSFYPGENMMPLYQPVNALLGNNPLLGNILAFIFIIVLSFFVLRIKLHYAFIGVRTILPSFLFILITCGLNDLQSFHPVYFGASFLLLTIDRVFSSYEKKTIHSNAFDSGLLLAIGSLFYFNLVFFFPFLWIGFIILRPTVNWREFILSILGFSFPWLVAGAFYMATDQMNELIETIRSNILTPHVFLKDNLAIQIYMGYLCLLTILGSFLLLSHYDGKKISSRKYFKCLFWIFLFCCALIAVCPGISQEIIMLLAIPLSYLISNYLVSLKRSVIGEILLYILTAGVIYLQFI
jgi:hypothetical protein